MADRAYDAQERVIERLQAQGCEAVILSKLSRREPRDYDQYLYQARHLIENYMRTSPLFAKLKQYWAIATRYDKTAINFLGSIHLVASLI